MALTRRTFIAGGAHSRFIGKGHPDFIWKRHPDFGKRENLNIEDHMRVAVDGCLEDTGVDPAAIDRLYVGNFIGELFSSQGHLGAALVGTNPAFLHKPAARLEGACASGGLAVLAGLDAIAAGEDIVLVVGVEVQTNASARVGGDYLARAAHYRRQRDIDDFTFPALFARRTMHYMDQFDLSHEDLGLVSLKAYNNANKNPYAHMHARKITLEWAAAAGEKNPNFLSNEEFAPFLKVSDCSQVSDGASALLLVSEAGLEKLGRKLASTIEITGKGHAVGNLYEDADPVSLDATRAAVARAYSMAGIGPDDLDVAEVHDCFTLTELLMYEAMGLADKGQGARLIREGSTQIDGRLPINTGGGLVGFGHPVGATGVKQPLEIFRQMKGRAGDYQVDKALNVGMTINMGGDDKTVVTLVMKNHG